MKKWVDDHGRKNDQLKDSWSAPDVVEERVRGANAAELGIDVRPVEVLEHVCLARARDRGGAALRHTRQGADDEAFVCAGEAVPLLHLRGLHRVTVRFRDGAADEDFGRQLASYATG